MKDSEKRRIMRSVAQEAEEVRIKGLLQVEESLWREGFLLVAGLDEAGRGPLAGPVFAAACVLPARFQLPGLNDSKLLNAGKREALFPLIQEQALAWAVAEASVAEIDSLNILQATKLAMVRAVNALRVKPHYLLIDALELPLALPQRALIGGDRLSASIAAASILAKVERDKLMERLDALYPGYGFVRHKGYGTREHLQALQDLGPCPAHRRSFAPVRTRAGGKTEFI
nr:ribonuclease HII [Acididesulfobacillus acetoxydans]